MEIKATNSVPDILRPQEEVKYYPISSEISVALLYSSPETGRWTVLFRCQEGSSFGRHKHYGAGEYYVVRGRMEYRAGSAPAGTYGFEPLGIVHDETSFPEETLLLFTNYGPVLFLDDDDTPLFMLDNAYLEELCGKKLRDN